MNSKLVLLKFDRKNVEFIKLYVMFEYLKSKKELAERYTIYRRMGRQISPISLLMKTLSLYIPFLQRIEQLCPFPPDRPRGLQASFAAN